MNINDFKKKFFNTYVTIEINGNEFKTLSENEYRIKMMLNMAQNKSSNESHAKTLIIK